MMSNVFFQESTNNNANHSLVPHPHLCFGNEPQTCEVYTKYSKPINLNIGLMPSVNNEEGDAPNSGEVCNYPLGKNDRL